jgi:predicted transcriptional regulator
MTTTHVESVTIALSMAWRHFMPPPRSKQLLADVNPDVALEAEIMKAIIEVDRKRSAAVRAGRRHTVSRRRRTPDFHLSYESARSLFAELTPARIDLLNTLRRQGPCSIYALAKAAERNYSNVHADVVHLEELGLIARDDDGAISVPYDAVEILVPLARSARAA